MEIWKIPQGCADYPFFRLKMQPALFWRSNMKKHLMLPALAAVLAAAVPAHADDEILTGDVRASCEAVLCLSSGTRPQECAPALKRYFSIRHKKFKDTLKAQRNFLKLCPTSRENADMQRLTDALANGAGRCDAAELNRVNRAYRTERRLVQSGRSKVYQTVRVPFVRNAKPDYCRAYFEHGWTTAEEAVRYVGDEHNGGRWVDVAR